MPLAIITGGTSGIGFQIARRLRDRGYALFIQGLADEHLNKAKACLEKEAKSSPRDLPPVTFLGADLAKPDAVSNLYEAACQYADQHQHPLEVLINSAGFGLFGEHSHLSQAQVTQMLQVNVLALTNLCQTFSKPFARQNKGFILNIASTTAFQPLPFLSAYAGSKAYVKQFSLALSQELDGKGIKVCCLCPGATNTPFLESTGLNEQNQYTLGQVLNHFAMDPAAVAEAGLAGLFSGKTLVTPGLINKGHYRLSRHVPEYVASKLGRLLLKPKSDTEFNNGNHPKTTTGTNDETGKTSPAH